MRQHIETTHKWLYEYDEINRLDLVRRTYEIPPSFSTVTQIREYLSDHRPDLRFVRSVYKRLYKVKTWPKVMVDESFSPANADPRLNSVQTSLGHSVCPSKLSFFQLMSLCIEFEIPLSPEDATTRERLLGRVDNFIKVCEKIDTFYENEVMWFIIKGDGVAPNNTSMEALASD